MDAFVAGHTNGLAFVIGFVILCATLVLLWLLDRVWLMLEDRRNERAHIYETYETSPYGKGYDHDDL